MSVVNKKNKERKKEKRGLTLNRVWILLVEKHALNSGNQIPKRVYSASKKAQGTHTQPSESSKPSQAIFNEKWCELLLMSSYCLHRDLSENFIQSIPRKAFRGATDIKNLWVPLPSQLGWVYQVQPAPQMLFFFLSDQWSIESHVFKLPELDQTLKKIRTCSQ